MRAASTYTPLLTSSYLGRIFPLQRFEMAQAACSIKCSVCEIFITPIKRSIPFKFIISFLSCKLLQAIFPNAQTACYTIPYRFDCSNFMKMGIASRSTIILHCYLVPEATFERVHIAYNCICGNYCCFAH